MTGTKGSNVSFIRAPAPDGKEEEMEHALIHRDKLHHEISLWSAPVLRDDQIDTMGQMYLASPLRRVMPFFAWVAKELGRWESS